MNEGQGPFRAVEDSGEKEAGGKAQLAAPTLSCGTLMHNPGFPALKVLYI